MSDERTHDDTVRYIAELEQENKRFRKAFSQSLDLCAKDKAELLAEIEQLGKHAERLMRAARQLLNDSRQQPRDYAREAIARYLEDYPEEAER